MSDTSCSICDKECKDHGKNNLLLKQHSERITNAESTIDIMNTDNSNTEGRLNTFMWGIGIIFMLIVSMSFYGVIQLSDFKTIYTDDNKETHQVISQLATYIEVTNNNVNHIKDDVEHLKEEQRNFINNSEKQISNMISLRNTNPIFITTELTDKVINNGEE